MDTIFRNNIFNDKYIGKIKNATVTYEYKSNSCSDNFIIYFLIKDNILIDVKYQIFGCIGLMAGCFKTCDMIINKSIEEILNITEEDILKNIGEFPEEKEKCILILLKTIKNENLLSEYAQK